MAHVVVTLDVTLDGESIFGRGPLVRRYEADESVRLRYEKAADNNATSFTAIPGLSALTTTGLLVVRASDARVTLRLNSQTDAGVPLAAGGLLLLLDTIGTAATVNNPEELDATLLDVVAAGA